MKLGITKEELPVLAERFVRYFGGMIAGAGIGMMLAVGFVPEDGRTVFHVRFYFTAGILICVGSIVASMANLFSRKKTQNEKHVA